MKRASEGNLGGSPPKKQARRDDAVHPSAAAAVHGEEAKQRIDSFLAELKSSEQRWQQDYAEPTPIPSVLAFTPPPPPPPSATQIRHDVDHSRTFIPMKALIATSLAAMLAEDNEAALEDIDEAAGTKHRLSAINEENRECILDIEGALEDVSLAFGMLLKRVNGEPATEASFPGSKQSTLRFVVPNSRVAPVIGKAGSRLRDVSEASGARLSVTQAVLPGTNERLLTIVGVADACHIAIFHVGSTILEHADRLPGLPGPSSVYSREPGARSLPGAPALQIHTKLALPAYASTVASTPAPFTPFTPMTPFSNVPVASGPIQTQQLFVPNELVGNLIGARGRAVNELREASGCQIKILDAMAQGKPGSDGLIILTGPSTNLQRAISMIRARIERETSAFGVPAKMAQAEHLPSISLTS